ncbi:MAG: hypothetical protein ABIJ12_13140 [bacterium]
MRFRKPRHSQSDSEESIKNKAELILNSSFESVKNDNKISTTPLNILQKRIALKTVENESKEYSLMAKVTNNLFRKPGLSIGLASGLCLIALFAFLPVSCSEQTGYSVDIVEKDDGSVSMVSADSDQPQLIIEIQDIENGTVKKTVVDADKLQEGLEAIGLGDAVIDHYFDGEKNTFRISNLNSEEDAHKVALTISQLTGMDDNIEINPVIEKVRASLLSHATDRLFNLDINTDGKTDEEIQAEITAQLEAAGLNNPVVSFINNDGQMQINITSEGEGVEGDSTIQMFEFKFFDSTMDSGQAYFKEEGSDEFQEVDVNNLDWTDGDQQKRVIIKKKTDQ